MDISSIGIFTRHRGQLTSSQDTYGHAEDRLLGLVNVTGTHFEDSAKETGCKKKKRGDGKSVKKKETPGIMRKKKGERRREGGPEKKILDRRALKPNQEAQRVKLQ
jgi:hypothetical protein